MALRKLIMDNELRLDHLQQIARGERSRELFVHYDPVFDALFLLTVPRDTDTVVHYIDDQNVALIYEADSLEIVGLQIEDFEYSFLPKHAQVQRVWKLRDALDVSDMQDYGDMIVKVEKYNPIVTREVFRASEDIFARQGEQILQSLRAVFEFA